MKFRKRLLLGLSMAAISLLWIGAQSSAAQVGTAAATSEATPTAPVTVKFEGVDGITLFGLYYPTAQSSAPALLLLNFKDSWNPWTAKWNALGFNIFAVDLRDFGTEDPVETGRKSIQDILLVIQQINEYPQVVPHQVALLGGSYNGGQALVACAKSPDCKTAILLSATNYKADLDDPIVTLGKRPLFIAVSKGEGIIAETDQDYARRAQGDHQIVLYDGNTHAMALLNAHPELANKIGDWLVKFLRIDDQATAEATGTS